MNSSRALGLIVLLIIVAFGSWWFLSRRTPQVGSEITVYYTKMDGTTEASWKVSMSPPKAGESEAQRVNDAAQYAAVQAVAGPPSGIAAVRFPPQTQVESVNVSGGIATVDLSPAVGESPGGSYLENGEFKSLVYTMTVLPGVNAVQVTIGGKKVAALPGGHLELDEPLHRSDW